MGNLLSFHYWSKLPDFTDDIVHFQFPNISGEDEKERNDFYDEVCGSVEDTRENVEKTVRLIERKLFSCLHALSHISFDYKKLIEMLQKESLNNREKIQDWSNRNASGCDKRHTDVELDFKRSEENREAEMEIENTVHQTEMEAMRRSRELLDEENRPSSPRLLNPENEMLLEWKIFMKTVSDNLEKMNKTANLTKNRRQAIGMGRKVVKGLSHNRILKERHVEQEQNAGAVQEHGDEQGSGCHVDLEEVETAVKTENEREEVAEGNETLEEVNSDGKRELDQRETINQKDNEPDKDVQLDKEETVGKAGNKQEEVAEEKMKQTVVEVNSVEKKELDRSVSENQKDNEPEEEEEKEKIKTDNVKVERTEEKKNSPQKIYQENGTIEFGQEVTEEFVVEESDEKEKTDPRVDNEGVGEENEEENGSTKREMNERELEEEREREEFEKLLAAKIEEGKEEEDLKLQEKQKEINTRIKTQEIDRNDILMAQEELEKASKDFQEHLEKRKKEFLEALKEKQKNHEEEMKRIRQARKEFEEETERIRLEDLKEIHAMMSAFSECIRLKLEWEIKEDEWSSLLKRFRVSISRTKNQFFWFLDAMKSLGEFDAEDIKNEELSKLQSQTYSTYDTLYEAYFSTKKLSTEFPDRNFLVILQKRLSDVCQCILSALLEIDNSKVNKNSLESLKKKFSKFDSSDIFYTSQLREMEINFVEESYKNIVDPKKYIPKSEVVINEMPANEDPAGNVQVSDCPNHEIGHGNRQTPEDLDTENTQLCY
ncbi:hypothetical protein B9Z55_020377 [Caenorhabditis nigoni]|uniref:Uncharacterized protein n=1 Tax=Caenorhabditis nigoni TaxID=1611254 RepID=A0A2G5TMH0_9PELO|nr:hypothetical protein B9Z55_020377 [Caenorhabditis nigoni]